MTLLKTASVALLFFTAQSQAYLINPADSVLDGNEIEDFSEIDLISFDANFFNDLPMIVSVERGSEDSEEPVRLSAVVNNFTGFSWNSFSMRLFAGASLRQVGDIFSFTAFEYVPSTLNTGVATTSFALGEAAGFEVGDVFDSFATPWLVDISAVSAGESFRIELAPTTIAEAVPEPATAMLFASAALVLGVRCRRRRKFDND